MDFFNRLTPGERLTAIGAIVVVISGLLGAVLGFGSGIVPVLGGIAVIVILYLKYSPTQNINWPAPLPLLLLAISGVTAVLAVVLVLPFLSILGFLGIAMLAMIGLVVGSIIMIVGSWQEYAAMPKATGTTSTGTTTTGTTTTSGGTTGTNPPSSAPPPSTNP